MRKILTMAVLLVGAYLPMAHADEDDDYAIEPANTAAMARVPSPATVADFYQPLGSYGYWVDDPSYGRVFVPYDTSFQPYTDGYWEHGPYGYVWMSNSGMGWAVEHYGRWVWQNRWMWLPDVNYSPGWVDWQVGNDGCVGWAPLGPSGYSIPAQHYRYVDPGYISTPAYYRAPATNTYGATYGSNGAVVVPSRVAPSVGWRNPPAPVRAPRVVPSTPSYSAPRVIPSAPSARVVPSFTPHYSTPRTNRHGRRG
jgi:hypothetical protein